MNAIKNTILDIVDAGKEVISSTGFARFCAIVLLLGFITVSVLLLWQTNEYNDLDRRVAYLTERNQQYKNGLDKAEAENEQLRNEIKYAQIRKEMDEQHQKEWAAEKATVVAKPVQASAEMREAAQAIINE